MAGQLSRPLLRLIDVEEPWRFQDSRVMTSRLAALNDPNLVFIIQGALSPEQCRLHMQRMDEAGTVATSLGSPRETVRKNARVILFDEALAGHLYQVLLPHVPASLAGMAPCGANECIRFYRYAPGDFFKPHQDTDFQRSATERSLLSIVVYLNGGYGGGELVLHKSGRRVTPVAGLAAVFGHRVVHESTPLTSGVKYALRSDVMYRKQPAA